MSPITKLLVANRGEIAIRVFRTCREMGIRTVAVYSEADSNAMHVEYADEAVCIGAPEAASSYLSIDKIIAACRETGANAVHPGYGFLSERDEFVDALHAASITFVGPPASAMRQLGDKISAKQLAERCNTPLVPGFFKMGATEPELIRAAHDIGFPVMLKASAGGGGRGMRAVFEPSHIEAELKTASDEALKAFGDGAMMVEKLIDRPRHIEVQILADRHGSVAVLFERECSLQRRHQKVIEEAPSPVMTDRLWLRMKVAAENLIREAGYVGAGTVEFIVNHEATDFYFLEVNARLQVEHPVTEMITGLDLVRCQIMIAQGAHLKDLMSDELLQGHRSAIQGHSIEARIIAEDPGAGFMPSIGTLHAWAEPTGLGCRVDTGYGTGREVSRYYDSMLAKVICHANTREAATHKLKLALEDMHVIGVKTNIEYVLDLLQLPAFVKADFDTKYLERELGVWTPTATVPNELLDLLSWATAGPQTKTPTLQRAWESGDGWRIV